MAKDEFKNTDVWSRPRTVPKEKSSSPFAIFKNPYALVGMGVVGYFLFKGGYNSALAMIPPPVGNFSPSSDYAKFAQGKRLLVPRGQPEANANLDDFYVQMTRPSEFGLYSINDKNSGKPYTVQWFSLVDGHSTGSTTAG